MRFQLILLWCLAIATTGGWCTTASAQVRGTRINILPAGGLINLALRSKRVAQEVGLYDDFATTAEIRKLSEVLNKEYEEQVRTASREDLASSDFITAKVHAKLNLELAKLLKPEQIARLKQIQWQEMGNTALMEAEMMKILEITKEQEEKFLIAHTEFITQLYGNNGRQIDSGPAADLRQAWDQQVKEILTSEQQAKFTQALGKAFGEIQLAQERERNSGFRVPRSSNTVRYRGAGTRHESLLGLALSPPLQPELGLKPDAPEFQKLAKLADGKHDDLVGRLANLTPQERRDRALTAKFHAGYDFELPGILKPEQLIRLRQVYWQSLGSGAFADPEIVKLLMIDSEQQKALASLEVETYRKLSQALNPQGAAVAPEEAELRKQVHEERLEERRRIDGILSVDQRQSYHKLMGSPFDLDLLINW